MGKVLHHPHILLHPSLLNICLTLIHGSFPLRVPSSVQEHLTERPLQGAVVCAVARLVAKLALVTSQNLVDWLPLVEVYIQCLEGVGAIHLIIGALRHIRWKQMGALSRASFTFPQLGVWVIFPCHDSVFLSCLVVFGLLLVHVGCCSFLTTSASLEKQIGWNDHYRRCGLFLVLL